MKVIAEGVENIEQFRFLDEKGCDYLQGFLFHYPAVARKIKETLASNPSKIDR